MHLLPVTGDDKDTSMKVCIAQRHTSRSFLTFLYIDNNNNKNNKKINEKYEINYRKLFEILL